MPEQKSALNRKRVTFYHPVEAPFVRVVTRRHGATLLSGEWAQAVNVRKYGPIIKSRGSMSASLATIVASGSFRGMWSGVFAGTGTMFVAMKDGSVVKVYKSTNGTAWTEITATATNGYPSSQLSDAFCFFDAVADPITGELRYLVIQNGTDYPRVYNGGAVNFTNIHEPIATSYVLAIQDSPVRYGMDRWFPIGDASKNSSHTDTNPRFGSSLVTLTGGNANTDNVYRWTINSATVTNNDNTVVVFTAALGAANVEANHCLIVGLDTSIVDPWSYLKLQIGSSGSQPTIFDPTDSTFQKPTPIGLDDSGRTLWVFDLRQILGNAYAYPGATIDRFTLVYKDPTSGAARLTGSPTLDIFCFAFGGTFSGGDRFGVSYRGGLSGFRHLESAGAAYTKQQVVKVREIGGPVVSYGANFLPLSPLIKFKVDIPYRNVSTTDRDRGINGLTYYLQQYGSQEFRRIDEYTLSTYSAGSWSYVTSGTDPYTLYKTVPYAQNIEETLAQGIQMPSGYHIPIPIGKGMKWVNARLFVGSTTSVVQGVGFSSRKHPFRFEQAGLHTSGGYLDPDGPGNIDLLGESCLAIASLATSTIGSSQIFAFTQGGVHVFGGSDANQLIRPSRVAPYGTLSPMSVQEMHGRIFWLDTEGQVQVMANGTIQSLTWNWVDDQLAAIPAARRPYVTAAAWNNRYYLFFSPAGASTNTVGLMWDDREQGWVNDAPPIAIEGLLSWLDTTSNAKRLIAIGSNAHSYEYDLEGTPQDLTTTDITVTLTTRTSAFMEADHLFTFNRVGVEMDEAVGATGTITRTMYPNGATGQSTIALESSSDAMVMRWDSGLAWTGTGRGVFGKVSLSLPVKAATTFFRIAAEVDDRGDHAYDR